MTGRARQPRLGLIVNPIAGLGGAVALKGTDGPGMAEEALRRGAVPKAGLRAEAFLRGLAEAGLPCRLLCASGEMGETAARAAAQDCSVLAPIEPGLSGAEATRLAARRLRDEGVDLLAFAGGDGTARDIAAAIGDTVPCLGIPAGVKIYSGVFGRTPRAAARLAANWLRSAERETETGEVVDVDEEALRVGRASVRLHDRLRVPRLQEGRQSVKQPVVSDAVALRGLAREVAERLARFDGAVILGPGGTMAGIAQALGIEKTLLGVDVIRNGKLLARDAGEGTILASMADRPALIVISPLGGQGVVLGRGNQQISPAVIRKAGTAALLIVATPGKLASLRHLRLYVDTGDDALDAELSGPRRVLTGFHNEMVIDLAP